MNKKLLTALIIPLAVTLPTFANSALEDAINDATISVFNMNENQAIEHDLAPLNREFTIVDKTLGYTIHSNSNKGFVNNNTLSIFAKSIEGFSTTGNGGAVYSASGTNTNIFGGYGNDIITSNHADGSGGAVYLNGMGLVVVGDKSGQGARVINNDANVNGGAFALVKVPEESTGGFLELRNVSVEGNRATGLGGGIYSDGGNVKVQSTNGVGVNVKYNIAGDGQYGQGVDVYATNGSKVSLKTDDNANSVVIIGDMKLVNNSELEKSGNVAIDTLTLDNSKLNTADGVVDTNEIKNLNVTGSNQWTLDADLSNSKADKINSDITGTGNIIVNLNPTTVARGDIDKLDLGIKSVNGATISTRDVQVDETMYNLSVNDDKTVKIALSQERAETLQGKLRDPEAESHTLQYNYVTSENLGEMVNNEDGNRTFTINGKYTDEHDHTYYSGIQGVAKPDTNDVPKGVEVTAGETLKLQDVSHFSGFNRNSTLQKEGDGGAIQAKNADIIITNPNNEAGTTFSNNTVWYAEHGGGAIYAEGGNGAYNKSTNQLKIDNATFSNNVSGEHNGNWTRYGGAIYAKNIKDIDIKNTNFIKNNKDGNAYDGGAIYINSNTYTKNAEDAVSINIENCVFDGNGGKSDVFIQLSDRDRAVSTITIKDSEFMNRKGAYASYSINVYPSERSYNFKSITLDGISVHDNTYLDTVNISGGSTLLKNSHFYNNVNPIALNALYIPDRYYRNEIQNTIFENNTAVLINTKGNITIEDSIIRNNILNKSHGQKGLVDLDQSSLEMTLNNVIFDGNDISTNDSYDNVAMIANYGEGSTITMNGGEVKNNHAHGATGHIIYGNDLSNFVFNDVKFQNNIVENERGGMIDNHRYTGTNKQTGRVNIEINAVNDNVVFSGNSAPNGKANDLYLDVGAKTYLNASAGHSINMEDIYVEHNPNTTTWNSKKIPTELYLNNKGGTGAINVGKITLENGATLYSANNRIDDLATITNLSLVGEASKLFVDADLRNNTIDKFKNVQGSALNLAVNIIDADPDALGGGSLTLFSGTVDNTLKIADTETIYGDNKYSFSQDAVGSAVLNYAVVKDRAQTLQSALEDASTPSYEMPALSVMTADLGTLALDETTGTRDFTIEGNQGLLTSQGHNGIVVNGTQDKFGTKLTVNNLGVASGFSNSTNENETHSKGSFISASEADLDINNSMIYGNTTNAKETLSYAKGGAVSIENKIDDAQLHTTNINNTEFSANKAISDKYQAKGGALYSNFNKLNIKNSTFSNNKATSKSSSYGGAVAFENSYPSTLEGVKLTIKDSVFENNNAVSTSSSKAMGGALAIVGNEGPSVTAEIENVVFRNNNVTTAGQNLDRYGLGGAIYNENGRITLKNVSFENNTATSTYGDGSTKYSDIANTGVNGSVTFLGGDVTLQGGIINDSFTRGGHVIVEDSANLTFDPTSQLQQGSLIINNGTVTVNSTDENNSLDRLHVAQGSALTLNSPMALAGNENAGASINNGTIVNNSDSFTIGDNFESTFTNNGAISGEGAIELKKGTFENSGNVANNITLSGSTSVLNSKYENITGNVIFDNSGATYNVLNNNLTLDNPNRIQSNGQKGKLYLQGNVLSNTTLNYTGSVYLKNGTVLTKGENGNVFQNAKSLIVGTGDEDIVSATLNVLNGAVDNLDYGNALSIGHSSRLNLEMDWGDTLASDSLFTGKVKLAKVDIRNTNDGDNYQFASSGVRDDVLLEDVDLITASGKANSIAYNDGTGVLSASRTSLANVISTSDETGSEAAYYNYSMGSNEQGNSTKQIVGNLKVNGNGNAIQTTGIVIGGNAADKSANVVLKDTNVSNVTTTAGATGAITVGKDSSLTIQADKNNVTLSGTKGANKNAIYMDTAGGNSSIVTLEANNGHSITINDDIRSNNENNQLIFNSGKINLNGVLDPLRAVNAGADVTRGGRDENIQWQLFGGSLRYLNDNYLSNTANLNSVEFAGGALDLRNGAASTIALDNITLSADSKMYVDADLAANRMDRLTSTTSNYVGGTLHIDGINLLSDSKTNKTTINFTNDDNLKGNIDYTGTALSRIFKYNVDYDNANGNFNFTRLATGSYRDYNPSVLAGSIGAQVGGYLTQLSSYDQAFYNMDTYMMMSSRDRQALKMRNQYAAADSGLTYDTSINQHENAAGWFRPYATFEKVPLDHGPKVHNIGYGTYMGGESKIYDMNHGWEGMWGAYVGYNGSHQNYDGVSIYQNGGTLGLNGMLFNGNFFQGVTINAGALAGQASTMYGSENFTTLTSGVASKTGYNWELLDGRFIIQPSWLMSYSFVNTFDYKNAAGVKIDANPIHAIQLQPELKFIGNLNNGWQPYASVAMIWNLMDDTKFKANDATLPEMSVKPYVKYGVGVRKSWGERFTGFLQTYFTNGGRNGVGIQAGFSWLFGKKK